MKNKVHKTISFIYSVLIVFIIACGSTSAQGIELGKTYDKSNIQGIENMLIPQVVTWVKNDGWTIKTAQLEFEMKLDDEFIQLSKKNEGKFKIDDDGFMVATDGGDKGYVHGLPFPTIDEKNPHAAAMMMENFKYAKYRQEGESFYGAVNWLGPKTLERSIVPLHDDFYYIGRRTPIANPRNFVKQSIVSVLEPFDLRGMNQLAWEFDDNREDNCWAYVPMLRRVRRVSAATRSDPFLGSDVTLDDTNVWFGKNSSMTWNFSEKKVLLMHFLSTKLSECKSLPDGTITMPRGGWKLGHEIPGWTGVAWAPTTLSWVPRNVWIIEAMPKDPYYSFGRQILYMDVECYVLYFKACYDRSGEYWRSYLCATVPSKDEQGRFWCVTGPSMGIDDRTHHCSEVDFLKQGERPSIGLIPVNHSLGPGHYTETTLRQLSK